jgi:hypothetical protein
MGISISITITIFPNTFRYIDNDINISLSISIFQYFFKYLEICPICQYFSDIPYFPPAQLSRSKWVKIKTLPYHGIGENCKKSLHCRRTE